MDHCQSLNTDFLHIVHQFLMEQNYVETAQKLEKETGCYFSMDYFESQVMQGKWDEVESYVSGFIKINESEHSLKIYFEVRKQKYLEAVEKKNRTTALDILGKEIKVFSSYNPIIYEELSSLIDLRDIRENENLSAYPSDIQVARHNTMHEVKLVIQDYPKIKDKLTSPQIMESRLRKLINQSLNWQHQRCTKAVSEVKTLFVDHTCTSSCESKSSLKNNSLCGLIPRGERFPPTSTNFISNARNDSATIFVPWMANPNPSTPNAVPAEAIGHLTPTFLPFSSKQSRSPPGSNVRMDQFSDNEHVMAHSTLQVDEMSVDNKPLAVLAMKSLFADMSDQIHCRAIQLAESTSMGKVVRLVYTSNGIGVFAMGYNCRYILWKWKSNLQNPSGKATSHVPPEVIRASSGHNEENERDIQNVFPCMVLTKTGSYAISASGGKGTLFNTTDYEVLETLDHRPSATTALALDPRDNNVVAIGSEDATLQIHNIRTAEVLKDMVGHLKKITGLAFSMKLNVLVSSGADAQLCVWCSEKWEQRGVKSVPQHEAKFFSANGNTTIQFHNDQILLLVVQESQIAIFDVSKLEFEVVVPMTSPISCAVYSSDCELIYASFYNGAVGVLDAKTLRSLHGVNLSAILPATVSSNLCPLAITAHPQYRKQFAIGLSEGGVYVVQYSDPEGKLGRDPADNGPSSSTPIIITMEGSELPSK